MYDKEAFIEILKKINNTYPNMSEFAEAAIMDRTYISKCINDKLKNPPTPQILEGIAKASKGITNYDELMQICGYKEKEKEKNMDEVIESLKSEFESKKIYQVNVPITDVNYTLKTMEAKQNKISFAIGYLKRHNKVSKEQALGIIFDILQGEI